MTAIILAAGLGTRLRPLTDSLPKCLLPIGGVPLLGRMLRALQAVPVGRIVIVTGHHAPLVMDYTASFGLAATVSCVMNEHFRSTGNNYSLWLAGTRAAGEEILVLDGDILFHQELLRVLVASPHANCLLYRKDPSLGSEEVKVMLDDNGMVRNIGKELDPLLSAGESVGIERFSAEASRRLFAVLEARKDRREFYEAAFQQLIDAGTPIHALECGGRPCIEIDTPDDLRAAALIAEAHAL